MVEYVVEKYNVVEKSSLRIDHLTGSAFLSGTTHTAHLLPGIRNGTSALVAPVASSDGQPVF